MNLLTAERPAVAYACCMSARTRFITATLFGKAPRDGPAYGPGRESIDVPDLYIDVVNELGRQHMLRVYLQRSPSPDQRVVVLPLMPIRDGHLHQNAGRSRIARERLLLATQPIVEPPERFLERMAIS